MARKKNSVLSYLCSGEHINSLWLVMHFVLLSSLGVVFCCLNTVRQEIHQEIHKNIEAIECAFQELLNNNNSILSLFAQKIAGERHPDLYYIARLLQDVDYINHGNQDGFRVGISWINDQNKIIASSLHGVEITPRETTPATANLVKKSMEEPWKMHLGDTIYPSVFFPGVYVFALSLGFTSKEGKYLGRLTAGVSIADLSKLLNAKISLRDGFFFSLTNRAGEIISTSLENGKSIGLKGTPEPPTPIFFATQHPVKNTSFMLKTGVRQAPVILRFLGLVAPKLLIIALVSSLFIFFLCVYRRRIKNSISQAVDLTENIRLGHRTADIIQKTCPDFARLMAALGKMNVQMIQMKEASYHAAKGHTHLLFSHQFLTKQLEDLRSEKETVHTSMVQLQECVEAKEQFCKAMQTRMTTQIQYVSTCAEILVHSQEGKLQNQISRERQKKLVNKMHAEVQKLKSAVINTTEKRQESMEHLLKSCVHILKPALHLQKGSLMLVMEEQLPTLALDGLSVQWAFLSLLSHLKFKEENVVVTISVQSIELGKGLRIAIKDQNKSIKLTDLMRVSERFEGQKIEGLPYGLDVNGALAILEKNGGIVQPPKDLEENTWLEVIFPILQENGPPLEKPESRIYYLKRGSQHGT